MPKKQRRRKRPGRHTVHTKDSRYNVPNYPRGSGDLVTRHGVTKTQHAWDVDDGMVASPIHSKPNDEWRDDHNRSDVVNVDYHGSSKSSQVWINKWEQERIEYVKRGKPLSKLNDRIIRHKASLALGKEFGESSEDYQKRKGLTEYYAWKLDTSVSPRDKLSKSLFDPPKKQEFPETRMFGNKEYSKHKRLSKKKTPNEEMVLRRLGIRSMIIADGDSNVFYVHTGDKALRTKQVVPEKPPKALLDKFLSTRKHKDEDPITIKGLMMNAEGTIGLIVEPKEVFKDLPTDPYKGRSSMYFNVDLPITAKADKMVLKDIKGKQVQGYEMIRVGNNVMDAKLVRKAVSTLGQKDLIFRAERKDYPIAIQNSKGTTLMVAPLMGMVSQEEGKKLPSIEKISGVESTSLTE